MDAETLDEAIGAAASVISRLCRALGVRLPPGAVDAIAAEVAEEIVETLAGRRE